MSLPTLPTTPLDTLTQVATLVPQVINRVKHAKALKRKLNELGTTVKSAADLVVKSVRPKQLLKPQIESALEIFAAAVKECLDLVEKICKANFFKRFIWTAQYEDAISGASQQLTFKLQLLNTAVSLMHLLADADEDAAEPTAKPAAAEEPSGVAPAADAPVAQEAPAAEITATAEIIPQPASVEMTPVAAADSKPDEAKAAAVAEVANPDSK